MEFLYANVCISLYVFVSCPYSSYLFLQLFFLILICFFNLILLLFFRFHLFYRDRKRMDLDGRGGEKDHRRVEGGEAVISVHCMKTLF